MLLFGGWPWLGADFLSRSGGPLRWRAYDPEPIAREPEVPGHDCDCAICDCDIDDCAIDEVGAGHVVACFAAHDVHSGRNSG